MNFATVQEKRYENSRCAHFYANSFALIRENYTLIRESFALIREIYNFFPYENEPNGICRKLQTVTNVNAHDWWINVHKYWK